MICYNLGYEFSCHSQLFYCLGIWSSTLKRVQHVYHPDYDIHIFNLKLNSDSISRSIINKYSQVDNIDKFDMIKIIIDYFKQFNYLELKNNVDIVSVIFEYVNKFNN